jgi:hypothetical protein
MKIKKINSILKTILVAILVMMILFLFFSFISWHNLKNSSKDESKLNFFSFIYKFSITNEEWTRYFEQLPHRLELANTIFDIRLKDSNEIEKYYEFSNYNLYFIGIEEIYIKENDITMTLREKLDNDKEYLIKMRNNMYYEYGIFDGGSTEYSSVYNDSFNEKIKMFTCNSMNSGNKDIHIAPVGKNIPYAKWC